MRLRLCGHVKECAVLGSDPSKRGSNLQEYARFTSKGKICHTSVKHANWNATETTRKLAEKTRRFPGNLKNNYTRTERTPRKASSTKRTTQRCKIQTWQFMQPPKWEKSFLEKKCGRGQGRGSSHLLGREGTIWKMREGDGVAQQQLRNTNWTLTNLHSCVLFAFLQTL